jgi:hypothetical protein
MVILLAAVRDQLRTDNISHEQTKHNVTYKMYWQWINEWVTLEE